jgi:hypothetical protein
MTLVETLVALVLLGFGILMAGSIVVWADRVEDRAACRAAALELAGNVAEQVRVAPYAAVRSGRLDLSGDLPPAGLEDPVVDLEVEEDPELGTKRVRVLVSWKGEAVGRLSLVTAVGRAGTYR